MDIENVNIQEYVYKSKSRKQDVYILIPTIALCWLFINHCSLSALSRITSSGLKLNNLLHLLVQDSCIIFILFPCCIQQLLAVYWDSSCWSVQLKREFFYGPRPSIDRARSPEDATSLINYAYTRASDKYYSLNRDPTGHKNDYNYAVSVDISRNITIKIFSLMLPWLNWKKILFIWLHVLDYNFNTKHILKGILLNSLNI